MLTNPRTRQLATHRCRNLLGWNCRAEGHVLRAVPVISAMRPRAKRQQRAEVQLKLG